MTKLYELHRNTYFKLVGESATPQAGAEGTQEATYLLKHIDGMYSYCLDNNGQPVHLAAWSEVEKVNV